MNEYGMPQTWALNTQPTDQELYEWFMSLTSVDKLKWIHNVREGWTAADECLMWDHKGRIANLEQALQDCQQIVNVTGNRLLMVDIKDAKGHE